MIYSKFRRSGPVTFWRGGPKNSGPPRTPPHPSIRLIHIPIVSCQHQNSEYIIINRFDTCRPKVLLTGASWHRCKKKCIPRMWLNLRASPRNCHIVQNTERVARGVEGRKGQPKLRQNCYTDVFRSIPIIFLV